MTIIVGVMGVYDYNREDEMKRCYPKPGNSGTIDIEIDGKEYTVAYYIEPPDPSVGSRGHIEVMHQDIGYIVDITLYQIKKRDELERKMEEAVQEKLNEMANDRDWEVGDYLYHQGRG